jgi:hypothetical protein
MFDSFAFAVHIDETCSLTSATHRYCSAERQKKDWPSHKVVCQAFKAPASGSVGPKLKTGKATYTWRHPADKATFDSSGVRQPFWVMPRNRSERKQIEKGVKDFEKEVEAYIQRLKRQYGAL